MNYSFGIRSVPPCSDCWEDGQCSMNCSKPGAAAQIVGGSAGGGKTARMMNQAISAARDPGKSVIILRTNGSHAIRNVTPEKPANERLDKMAALMDDYWRGNT